MTRHLYVLNTTDLLSKAKKMFKNYNIRHLPVLSNHQVVGMLSINDIARLTFENDFLEKNPSCEEYLKKLKVEDVMHLQPDTVQETDTIEMTAKKIRDKHFHVLPVVNKERIAGIITTTDIIDFFLDGVDSEFNKMKNR